LQRFAVFFFDLLQKWGFLKGSLTFAFPKEGIFAANALFCPKSAAKPRCAFVILVLLHRVF
jgi:hypothetical protein